MSIVVDPALLASLQDQAEASPRKRSNHNLHESFDSAVQRLGIHLHPDTYIPAHKHLESNKWELMLILDGEMDLVLFDEDGKVSERHQLSSSKVRAVEIPPNTWHSIATGTSGATIMEIKEGPYTPITGEGLAPWAPADSDSVEVARFKQWLSKAQVGECFSA